jgi:hypothetical protein
MMEKETAHSLAGVRFVMNATRSIGPILSKTINSLRHIVEGKIEGTIRQQRRCKQLLDAVEEKRKYWKLKEETLDRTL